MPYLYESPVHLAEPPRHGRPAPNSPAPMKFRSSTRTSAVPPWGVWQVMIFGDSGPDSLSHTSAGSADCHRQPARSWIGVMLGTPRNAKMPGWPPGWLDDDESYAGRFWK